MTTRDILLSARGSTVSDVCRRQILTSKVDPRAERVSQMTNVFLPRLFISAVQRQTAVTAYLKSKQLLLFVFAILSSSRL